MGQSGSSGDMQRHGISAVVVCYNEAVLLPQCLDSLGFCSQVIVVDLGSSDGSVETAKTFGAEVLHHPRVAFGEQVRAFALPFTKNDWVLFIDPDEVISAPLAADICETISGDPDAATVRVPWQFYFKGKQLTCCIWGAGDNTKTLLAHKQRAVLSPLVHTPPKPSAGYREITIPREGNNCVEHYWMASYGQLFEKHRRYLQAEGESRYARGQRFSRKAALLGATKALKTNLVDYRGVLGGFRGLFLSFFYAWYTLMGWYSLKEYEKHLRQDRK